MKTKEIAKAYDIDQKEFENYLLNHKTDDIKVGLFDISIENDVQGYVDRFRKYLANGSKEPKEPIIIDEEMQRAVSNMLITSGFTFDGYRITKYSGYISGDDAISIPRGTEGLFSSATDVSTSLTDSLVKIRRQALLELKVAAYNLGCNAVIGVDFDYITLEPETANSGGGTCYLPYVFCVTANGNAVVIEKEE